MVSRSSRQPRMPMLRCRTNSRAAVRHLLLAMTLTIATLLPACGPTDDVGELAARLTVPPESGCTSQMFGEHMYWFCTPDRDWATARSKCQTVGFDLVRIDSSTENTFLGSAMPSSAWIGAGDPAVEGAWRWNISGDQFWQGTGTGHTVGGLYANWALLQPDNALNQDCGRFDKASGKWTDESCTLVMDYVCESVQDLCPRDPSKIEPGICGCGVADTDSDADGVADCQDQCPHDQGKVLPGDCGCADAPMAAGTACDDGFCSAATTCNGAGRCGGPQNCAAPDSQCTATTFAGSNYWICNNDRAFSNARQRCQTAGMDLTVIDSASEDSFVTSKVTEHSFIGASDSAVEGDWVWLPTNQLFWTGGKTGHAVNSAYTNWETNQPAEGLLSTTDCAVKDPSIAGGRWETRACTDQEAFVCELRLPQNAPPNQDFDPSPFLPDTNQSANQVGSTTQNPNYLPQHTDGSPRHDYCGAGLEIASSLQGIEVEKTLQFASAPTNTVPGDPDCHVAYKECSEDEQELPPATVTSLNAVPAETDICEAVAPKDVCEIDESSIDLTPQGLCQVDEECLLRGMICALVCSDATCSSQEHRCARPKASCEGLPEVSLCTTTRECAEPDAVGDGNPGAHQMASQPATDIHPRATPDASTVPEGSPLDPVYTIGTPCALAVDDSENATIPQQIEPRDANAGNEKWGVFIHPEVNFGADVFPDPIGGEADHFVRGEAVLKAGAYVWGQEVHILDVEGKADLSRCAATINRKVEIMGESIDVGSNTDTEPTDCLKHANDRRTDGNELKKALLDALLVRDYFSKAGATQSLCELTESQFNRAGIPTDLAFSGDCTDPAVQRAAVDHWVHRYDVAIAAFQQDVTDLTVSKQTIVAALPTATLPILNFERNFTTFAASFTYPVGPATVTVDVDLGGSWGVFGELTVSQKLNPGAVVDAHATIKPTLSATASAFAGVGFGPVSFGVGGDLLIVSLQTPLQAGATIRQTFGADTRPINLLGVPGTGVPVVFDQTLHDWSGDWAEGARAQLTELAGDINLQARISLLFFHKTFKVRLAKWNGTEQTIPLVGDAQPLSDDPTYGTFEEQLAFVDPSWIRDHLAAATAPDTSQTLPSIGLCGDIIR